MDDLERCKLVPVDGYTPAVGTLVRMMDLVRLETLQAVTGLTTAQLDHLHDAKTNSIGALLAHMAAVETVHAIRSFENRQPSAEEWAESKIALRLGDGARREFRGKPLEHYLENLATVRERSKSQLRTKDDDWLFEERDYIDGLRANNYYIWFHIPEDETSHRGQIRWLRKRLGDID